MARLEDFFSVWIGCKLRFQCVYGESCVLRLRIEVAHKGYCM